MAVHIPIQRKAYLIANASYNSYMCYSHKYGINDKFEILGFCSHHLPMYELITNYVVNLNMISQVLGFFPL